MTKTSLTLGIPHTLNSLEPIEIKDEQANLHAAYVERYAAEALPSEWDKEVEGFYVLLSHINPDNTFTAYVGKTDWSFSRRLKSHVQNKNFWNVAILFKKNSLEGFNRNQTSYMEGELVKALSSSPNVTVTNEKPTGDRTFNDWDKPYMEQVLLSALRILFVRGYRNAHMGAITQVLESHTRSPCNPLRTAHSASHTRSYTHNTYSSRKNFSTTTTKTATATCSSKSKPCATDPKYNNATRKQL